MIFCSSWGQKSKLSISRVNFFWKIRESILSTPLLPSDGCWQSWACGCELQSLPLTSHGLVLCLFLLVSCLIRMFVIEFKANPGNPGWHHLEILNLMASVKVLLSNMVPFTGFSSTYLLGGYRSSHCWYPGGVHLCLQRCHSLFALTTCFGFGGDQKYLQNYTQPMRHTLSWCWRWNATGPAKRTASVAWPWPHGGRQKRKRTLCNFRAMQMIETFHWRVPSCLFFPSDKKLFSILSEQGPLWPLGILIPVDCGLYVAALIDVNLYT